VEEYNSRMEEPQIEQQMNLLVEYTIVLSLSLAQVNINRWFWFCCLLLI
jgi:hypothetical protein